jgi:hypothetical protein
MKGVKNSHFYRDVIYGDPLGPEWPKNEKIEENEIILSSQRNNSDPIKLAVKFIHYK